MATIEIHRDGAWTPAASLDPLGEERCRFEYLAEYIFGDDPQPIALGMPVGFTVDGYGSENAPDRRPPPFLYDLAPQGKGRDFLLNLLKLDDAQGLLLPLILAGAFNPIGRLRIGTAVNFFEDQSRKNPGNLNEEGLALADILKRSEQFLSHLSLHSMLAAGTTGVQGVAPKFLMTQNAQGGWFADMALPDPNASAHWLLKLPRGKSDEDRAVLRNEAAYLKLASACGLRGPAEDDVWLRGEILFTRRFDRQVRSGRVHRLHQQSLASLAGLRGFGVPTSQNTLLSALRRYATDPFAETAEFIKRDVLNLAMRNTDNHARNTAIQITSENFVRLTPVFDFAPMFMDPEVVPRTVHWRDRNDVRLDNWSQVLESLVDSKVLTGNDRIKLITELRAFGSVVQRLAHMAQDCGVEPEVLRQCEKSIENQAAQLATLQS